MKRIALSAAFLSLLTLGACSGEKGEVKLGVEQEKAMSERLAPAGEVSLVGEVASAPAAGNGGGSRSGSDVYSTSCKTCHDAGMAGAPKLGAPDQWAARIDKGMDTLYTSAISGFQGMPPKGLCMDCSDDELKAAVDYMIDGSQ
ncbi:MAG: cytochrome c5 family protein [Gammaproteobacteria bacterium]|nr:cytochrome c5 family protein [Gammaproteobacteria bacterium]MBQ0839894.1 cytochrome c5 family protein [Gammaproteobacteria bacterium]